MEEPPTSLEQAIDLLAAARFEIVASQLHDIELPERHFKESRGMFEQVADWRFRTSPIPPFPLKRQNRNLLRISTHRMARHTRPLGQAAREILPIANLAIFGLTNMQKSSQDMRINSRWEQALKVISRSSARVSSAMTLIP